VAEVKCNIVKRSHGRDYGDESISIYVVQVTHLSFLGTHVIYHLLCKLN